MIDASAVARVLGIETKFQDMRAGGILFLPQRVAITGQGTSDAVYSSTKYPILSAADAGARYGYGSPIHHAARALLPVDGDGGGTSPVTVSPLQQLGGAAAAAGDITPAGTQLVAGTYRLLGGNV